jgi:hypothetical protein
MVVVMNGSPESTARHSIRNESPFASPLSTTLLAAGEIPGAVAGGMRPAAHTMGIVLNPIANPFMM